MSIVGSVKIGADTVDLDNPCDVATALRKVELAIAAGGKPETIRFGEDEVTFTRANGTRLAELIRQYDEKCARKNGGCRTRYAKRVCWV